MIVLFLFETDVYTVGILTLKMRSKNVADEILDIFFFIIIFPEQEEKRLRALRTFFFVCFLSS